ncbi:hypothetical protein AB7M56_000281 [Bradyrhizobium elkanii]|jgi:hypothetical protein|uniref:Uncharacterized protein n=1 Tax=Bradyrhizobium elkanii TaxID=29448 RepID=A0A8I2BWV7_BRAEL|nr:hypothetical protein [Bradyrhizobium elkanii]MCP1975452.1 hypothetical protein [Bradyrhizobium elkanii]MCS3525099.1 hypothetical protein [Bradyrhizobium elkanii]MCS4075689.1 hypothetical protein [Bradyrhizobium elkanii]MCS4085062.1 hypothetical protein [Bradyrhizobium elkanii]
MEGRQRRSFADNCKRRAVDLVASAANANCGRKKIKGTIEFDSATIRDK